MKTVMTALLLAVSAFGPEINGADSVEWLAYDCDVIVRGKVVRWREVVRDGDTFWAVVSVRAEEVLKGSRAEEVSFVSIFWDSDGAERPKGWVGDEVERLFFLVKSERYRNDTKIHQEALKASSLALRDESWSRRLAIRLDGQAKIGIFDADFREHTGRREILDAMRKALAAMDKEKPTALTVSPPEDSPAHRKLNRRSGVSFILPLDGAMHQRARPWLLSEDWILRLHAVDVLSRFKSDNDLAWLKENFKRTTTREFRWATLDAVERHKTDEHVELTRLLLADPSYEIKYVVVEGKQQEVGCEYTIRKKAYRLLQSWGIEVPKPVLEKPKPTRPIGCCPGCGY